MSCRIFLYESHDNIFYLLFYKFKLCKHVDFFQEPTSIPIKLCTCIFSNAMYIMQSYSRRCARRDPVTHGKCRYTVYEFKSCSQHITPKDS